VKNRGGVHDKTGVTVTNNNHGCFSNLDTVNTVFEKFFTPKT
jgi:hypothetical protein